MGAVSDLKNKALTAYLAMFFAGLILLIPHRIGMSRVNYIIKRYNLPISRAGLLLYKFHNPIEVSLTIGTLLGNVINWIYGASGLGDNHEKGRILIRYFMIIFLFLMFLSSIYMYHVYVIGDDFGHLNSFYFSLILITLFDGITNAFAFALNGKQASMLAAGIPTSGALVSVLHNIYKFFSDSFHWDDFDYYVLRLQLLSNVLTMLITFILWSFDQGFDISIVYRHTNNSSATDECTDSSPIITPGTNFITALTTWGSSGVKWRTSDKCVHDISAVGQIGALFNFDAGTNDANYGDWSPICMLAISLGTVYAFYPSIAPYSIIDYQYASVIELWILIISAIPTLVIAILDFTSDNLIMKDCGSPPTPQKGPSGIRVDQNKFNNWNPDHTTGNYWWHSVWFCAIPYILCIQIFMSMLHYPCSLLSSLFFNNPYAIGFISVLFNTLRETMQACGFAGAGKQNYSTAQSGDNAKVNGYIAPINKLITLFVMMFCVFTGDGYLQHYRRCCRDCWPTTGYNRGQSFFYWLRYGFKGGSKSFITSFTTTVKTQNIITNNVIGLFMETIEPFILSAVLLPAAPLGSYVEDDCFPAPANPRACIHSRTVLNNTEMKPIR